MGTSWNVLAAFLRCKRVLSESIGLRQKKIDEWTNEGCTGTLDAVHHRNDHVEKGAKIVMFAISRHDDRLNDRNLARLDSRSVTHRSPRRTYAENCSRGDPEPPEA